MKKITKQELADDLAGNATYRMELAYLSALSNRTTRQAAELEMRRHYLDLAEQLSDTIIATGHAPLITWLFATPSQEQDKQVMALERDLKNGEQQLKDASQEQKLPAAFALIELKQEFKFGVTMPREIAFALNKALFGKYDVSKPLHGVPSNMHDTGMAIHLCCEKIDANNKVKPMNGPVLG